MKSKQTMFFAIEDDLYPSLKELERNFEIEYILMGSFETNEVIRYFSFSEIPHIGYTNWSSWAGLDHRYLIVPKDSFVEIEEVAQRRGGVRFIIDPMKNPNVVAFCTGGIYTKKENVIIAGTVTGSVPEFEFSVAVYKLLASRIKKKFSRIGAFYVGPKAEEKLKEGWRLVTNEKSPKEYDLVYPNK